MTKMESLCFADGTPNTYGRVNVKGFLVQRHFHSSNVLMELRL